MPWPYNRTVLKIVGVDGKVSSKYKVESNGRSGSFEMTVRLPASLLCERCVFQWTYMAGPFHFFYNLVQQLVNC